MQDPSYARIRICSHVTTALETVIFCNVKLQESAPPKLTQRLFFTERAHGFGARSAPSRQEAGDNRSHQHYAKRRRKGQRVVGAHVVKVGAEKAGQWQSRCRTEQKTAGSQGKAS